jgi:hypothetical protein
MGAVAIVTASLGAYDRIHPQRGQDIGVDWFAVVDEPGAVVPSPWVRVDVAPSGNPWLAAKAPKMTPWEFVDHPHVIWIDANMEVTHPGFAREALACRHDGVAMFEHPRRDCIYAEAGASVGAESQGGKYADQPIAEQVARYRAGGHPEHGGLFACGTIAWDATHELAREFGAAWLAECERWSVQDQLSAPVVARRLGLEPGVFPFAQISRGYLGNKWLRIHPHG